MPQRGRADTKAALGHDSEDCTNAISQSNLRKYVAHARATCRPKLHAIDQNKVSCLYAELRRESANCGGIPIAVRHLESLMRMAEAQVSQFQTCLLMSGEYNKRIQHLSRQKCPCVSMSVMMMSMLLWSTTIHSFHHGLQSSSSIC